MNTFINKFMHEIKTIDKDIIKLTKKSLTFTLFFCIIATLFLITYNFYSAPELFIIGASLLKYGIIYFILIIVCSISFNKIKNDLTQN